LNTAVPATAHATAGATLTLASAEVVKADATIVTVPGGAIGNVELSPALPGSLQSITEAGCDATGAKIWIKIKGHHRFLGYAPYPAKMSVVRSEYFMDDDTTILVGFGGDHSNVDLNDTADAHAIMNQWEPAFEVVDATGHDWVAD